MNNDEITKMIRMNERLNFLLGYSLGFIMPFKNFYNEMEKKQYDWLMKAVENICYLDIPLPCPP